MTSRSEFSLFSQGYHEDSGCGGADAAAVRCGGGGLRPPPVLPVRSGGAALQGYGVRRTTFGFDSRSLFLAPPKSKLFHFEPSNLQPGQRRRQSFEKGWVGSEKK